MSMNIRLSTKVHQTDNWVTKHFDGLVQVQKYLAGFSSWSFYDIELMDHANQFCFTDWDSIQQYIERTLKPLGKAVPQYMFKDAQITGIEWIALQERTDLDCYPVGTHLYLLTDPATREYCFVYSDEADQLSNPYPTLDAAQEAMSVYMRNL
ncbi:hypothetical protein MIF8_44 [Erwinia phage MIF8]